MKVHLTTGNDLLNYTATNERGNSLLLSGNKESFSPMETLLAAAAGCSTIDIVMILEKMKQSVTKVKVNVEGERREDHPRYFTTIHLHYIIHGEVKEKKADQAVRSSLEKYCSVSKMIDEKATITSSFELINET